jgi:hypothetical protein
MALANSGAIVTQFKRLRPANHVARINRDHPEVHRRMRAGEFKSVRAAAIQAAIIKVPSPYESAVKAVAKPSKAKERRLFKTLSDQLGPLHPSEDRSCWGRPAGRTPTGGDSMKAMAGSVLALAGCILIAAGTVADATLLAAGRPGTSGNSPVLPAGAALALAGLVAFVVGWVSESSRRSPPPGEPGRP